jgi:multidrug efflux pump subunit AcrA (membrane-fusion protein)
MKRSLILLCVVYFAGCEQKKDEPPEKPTVAVKVARAEITNLPQVIAAPATLFPREQANITSRIAAPIRELRAKKGDTVNRGQALAVLENRDIVAQQREAQAALQDAEENLKKTVGAMLPADVERARGQVETTRAALDQAQKNFERRQQLFKQGAIPQRDLLQTETELATARANFNVAQKSLDLLQNQSQQQDIAIAKSRVAQAQARLAGANAGLQFTELRSPFAGTVTEQFQYPGDMAKPDTPVFTVMDLSTVIARAQAPDGQAGAVRKGQPCSFASGDVKDSETGGHITVVSRAVDPARRTVEVWCEIPKPSMALRAGMFGTVRIQTGSIANAVIVPEPAVQFQEGTRNGVVFVVDEKHIAHKRDVEAGATFEGKVHIRKGIQAGEQVVTEGGYSLPDGAKVLLPGEKPEGETKK